MSQIPFYILNAFTNQPFAGNPAGVFFDDAAVLSAAQMRRMAGEVGLESAFVTPAALGSDADFCLRYFTGVTEVPFCGHDTVATMAALVHTRRVKVSDNAPLTVRFQTPVGILAVDFRATNGLVTLNQNRPEFSPPLSAALTERVFAALGLAAETKVDEFPVQRVSTGTPWLIVPVQAKESVNQTPTDFDEIARISRETETFGMYVFARDEATELIVEVFSVWSRCYAPIAGLNEDPVTGSASGALGGYLASQGLLMRESAQSITSILAQQGFAGGRGGEAEIMVGWDAEGAIDRIAVSGQAVLVAEGAMAAPPTT